MENPKRRTQSGSNVQFQREKKKKKSKNRGWRVNPDWGKKNQAPAGFKQDEVFFFGARCCVGPDSKRRGGGVIADLRSPGVDTPK